MIKILRLATFLPRMNSILSGLGRALKSSIFVLIALLFLNFIIALFTTHIYGDLEPKLFGDPLKSSYNIFKIFTVEGWYEIPDNLVEDYPNKPAELQKLNPKLFAALSRFYFIIVVLIGGIFGMSLANAIFVDEMTIDNNDAIETKMDLLMKKIDGLEGQIDIDKLIKKIDDLEEQITIDRFD